MKNSDMKNNFSDELAYLTGQLSECPSPPAITGPDGGGKFDHNGQVLAWPGNTIICHVDSSTPEHKTLTRIQKQLKAGPHANAFAFLPPDSFHMTIMDGLSGTPISEQIWPIGLDKNNDLHSATELIRQRLVDVVVPGSHQIKVTDIFAGHSVRVEGSTDDQERSLRRTREILRDTTGIKPKAFSAYRFHITFAYLTRWLSTEEANSVAELSNTLADQLRCEAPVITLGAPEFCVFESMLHFEKIARL
jgi:hypothetical protein